MLDLIDSAFIFLDLVSSRVRGFLVQSSRS